MKRHQMITAAVAAVALLGACGDDDEPAADPTVEQPDDGMFDPAPLEQYVGAPLAEFTAEAEALGAEVRVVERDGEPLAVTMDLRPNRVNVAVEGPDEVVTRIVNVG